MAERELTDKEIAATIFHKLRRRGICGGKYKPRDSVKRWIEGKIRKDGKRVEKIIDGLIKEDLLLSHKGGETISLNPKRWNIKALFPIFPKGVGFSPTFGRLFVSFEFVN